MLTEAPRTSMRFAASAGPDDETAFLSISSRILIPNPPHC
jgi:hypothetical protein